MIKQSVLDELRQKMDITEIISQSVHLKKRGSGHIGLCPFHNEKTPSFNVWPAKQIFKCFGCGEGGDAIKFVQKQEKKNFTEAVEWLCHFYNVAIEHDQAAKEEAQEKKTARELMQQIISWAHKKYEALLHSLPEEAPAIRYLQQRGYDAGRMRSWSLGFAPDDWKFLTTPLINKGKHGPAVDCGIVVSKDAKNFDFFRNRIIIPIHDHNGILAGLAGRWVPSGDPAEDKKAIKYLNLKESPVYSKSKLWYGLHQAYKAIKEAGYAYIVEGYMDVHAMHDAALINAVASCGTEVDDGQVKLLKRYTDHVVIAYDGDEPGLKKAMKHVDLFLKADFKVSVLPFPDGMDPDEYIKHLYSTQANVVAEAEEVFAQ